MRIRPGSLSLVLALLAAGVPLHSRAMGAGQAVPTLARPVARGLGGRISHTDGRPAHLVRVALSGARSAAAPATVDLTANDPSVGDQGSVNSCASWATGYYLRGWLANSYQTPLAQSFAPMSVYAQITNGQNIGTSFNDNFSIEQNQGIDTWTDYTQGPYDYTDQPTAAEMANAAAYTETAVTELWQNDASYGTPGTANGGPALQTTIENSLANGAPVVLLLPVFTNFYYDNMTDNGTTYPVLADVPPPGMTFYGWHGVFAPKYDSNGLWVENQWGTSWGQDGYAELSWAFVEQYVVEVWTAAVPVTAPPAPTATSTETPAPTAASTETPAPPAPTATSTPLPTATSTNTPALTATSTSTPLPTATSTNTPAPTATSTTKPVHKATSTSTPVPTATTKPSPTSTAVATPVISAVSASAGAGSFTVKWTTNVPASSTVLYGTTPQLGSSTTNSTLVTAHSMTINRLARKTLYYYEVRSASSGSTTTSALYSIRTN